MIEHIVMLPCQITVFQQTMRDNSQDWKLKGMRNIAQTKVDLKTKITTFSSKKIGLDNITSMGQLRDRLEDQIPHGDGVYYLFAHNKIKQKIPFKREKKRGSKKKKRKGRRPFDREALRDLGIRNRPRQTIMGGCWNCLLKFQMYRGRVVKIFEKKCRRKRHPYTRSDYAVIRIMKKNKKSGLL